MMYQQFRDSHTCPICLNRMKLIYDKGYLCEQNDHRLRLDNEEFTIGINGFIIRELLSENKYVIFKNGEFKTLKYSDLTETTDVIKILNKFIKMKAFA